ncbi:hypothetical protein C8Q77DRAFT_1074944 [Trametes polyzona]|nr:hypothetical protein C8Q77DRAFT_1074944 [Trametes polyzona]
MAKIGPTRDDLFYSDHVICRVENRLFKVPKQKFIEGSDIFRDMFALPVGNQGEEGHTDERPLFLEGVNADEFRTLLKAMFKPVYAPSTAESIDLTTEEWVSVLKLTTRWDFSALRRVAIYKLATILSESDSVRWLCLARQFNVGEWLLESLARLARRTQALQMEEVDLLGIETVVKMAEVRESYNAYSGSYMNIGREGYDFSPKIKQLFKEELDAAKVSYY